MADPADPADDPADPDDPARTPPGTSSGAAGGRLAPASADVDAPAGAGPPAPLPGSGTLDRLAAGARAYAAGALAANTARAYAADWAHYARWCRRHGAAPLPPAPQVIGLYLRVRPETV